MARVISLRDLQRIPTLRTYTEDALIRPDMDHIMFMYLAELGYDMDSPIEYIPSIHRDLAGNVGLGYQVVGEIVDAKTKHPYLRHKICPLYERIAALAKSDMSFAIELARMASIKINLTDNAEEDEEYPDNEVERTYKENTAKINKLITRRNDLRKTRYDEKGRPLTPKEILKEMNERK